MLRRVLLSPLALIWATVLRARHVLYDTGLLQSRSPALPTIVVGNLALGGTGKTPHVELVLEALIGTGQVATLSRGYGRSGKESREVNDGDPASLVGDEPLMLKRAHPNVRVFVGADRLRAIEEIQRLAPEVRGVVLDDAFQHRRLKAGLNILLTSWSRPWSDDALLPAGYLRDLKSCAKAAQVVIVSKSPELPDPKGQEHWRMRLGLSPGQQLFFSTLDHGVPVFVHGGSGAVPSGQGSSVLLVTGIADPEPLSMHARSIWGRVERVRYPDHHPFTPLDLGRLAGAFATFADPPKTLVTTAKDAVRLLPLLQGGPLEKVPIAVVPVKARVLNEPERFDALVRQHLAAHPAHG